MKITGAHVRRKDRQDVERLIAPFPYLDEVREQLQRKPAHGQVSTIHAFTTDTSYYAVWDRKYVGVFTVTDISPELGAAVYHEWLSQHERNYAAFQIAVAKVVGPLETTH